MELPYDGISVGDVDQFIRTQSCMVPMNSIVGPINCGCCGVTRATIPREFMHFVQTPPDTISEINEGREGIVIPDETTNLTIDWIDK